MAIFLPAAAETESTSCGFRPTVVDGILRMAMVRHLRWRSSGESAYTPVLLDAYWHLFFGGKVEAVSYPQFCTSFCFRSMSGSLKWFWIAFLSFATKGMLHGATVRIRLCVRRSAEARAWYLVVTDGVACRLLFPLLRRTQMRWPK